MKYIHPSQDGLLHGEAYGTGEVLEEEAATAIMVDVSGVHIKVCWAGWSGTSATWLTDLPEGTPVKKTAGMLPPPPPPLVSSRAVVLDDLLSLAEEVSIPLNIWKTKKQMERQLRERDKVRRLKGEEEEEEGNARKKKFVSMDVKRERAADKLQVSCCRCTCLTGPAAPKKEAGNRSTTGRPPAPRSGGTWRAICSGLATASHGAGSWLARQWPRVAACTAVRNVVPRKPASKW
jgi:hypothetical protein